MGGGGGVVSDLYRKSNETSKNGFGKRKFHCRIYEGMSTVSALLIKITRRAGAKNMKMEERKLSLLRHIEHKCPQMIIL
jgi:hypothetical protein